MIIRTLSALLLLTCFAACGGGETSTASTTPPPAPAAVQNYPSIEVSRLEYLFTNATYMDATFYTLPVSINQSGLPQIQSTLAGIAADPMPLYPDCQPIGHIWFQVKGENIEEADIYYQANCTGYVWYEDGKPAYANKLTEQGINFYRNIMESVKTQSQGQGQQ